MIETHKSATSLAMIFGFVLHFFDFAVDVCRLYGEAASVSSSALVVESYGNLEMIRNSK